MNHTDYSDAVLALKSPHFDPNNLPVDLTHAVLGLVTESGELADVVKRCMFYGKGEMTPDQAANVLEELGDILWYLTLAMKAMGTNLDETMTRNLLKLRARYPDKFNTDAAYNRNIINEALAVQEGMKPKE